MYTNISSFIQFEVGGTECTVHAARCIMSRLTGGLVICVCCRSTSYSLQLPSPGVRVRATQLPSTPSSSILVLVCCVHLFQVTMPIMRPTLFGRVNRAKLNRSTSHVIALISAFTFSPSHFSSSSTSPPTTCTFSWSSPSTGASATACSSTWPPSVRALPRLL